MYEDGTKDAESGLAGNTEDYEDPVMGTGLDRKVPTPEVNDNYVNASFVLPIGDIYARWNVVGRKVDADGNSVGRANNNPILDTREYIFGFEIGEVSELTTNVIEESMYVACDDSVNDYLMMDSIVDYQNSDKAISLSSQKVVHRGWSFMRRSTVGWQLYVQWIDGLKSCQALKYLKGYHPVDT